MQDSLRHRYCVPRCVPRFSGDLEHVVNAVIASLETTLLNHLGMDGFTLKLNGFGKFYVRHRPGICRKIGFTGETIQTKMKRKIRFISLGALRQRERAK